MWVCRRKLARKWEISYFHIAPCSSSLPHKLFWFYQNDQSMLPPNPNIFMCICGRKIKYQNRMKDCILKTQHSVTLISLLSRNRVDYFFWQGLVEKANMQWFSQTKKMFVYHPAKVCWDQDTKWTETGIEQRYLTDLSFGKSEHCIIKTKRETVQLHSR